MMDTLLVNRESVKKYGINANQEDINKYRFTMHATQLIHLAAIDIDGLAGCGASSVLPRRLYVRFTIRTSNSRWAATGAVRHVRLAYSNSYSNRYSEAVAFRRYIHRNRTVSKTLVFRYNRSRPKIYGFSMYIGRDSANIRWIRMQVSINNRNWYNVGGNTIFNGNAWTKYNKHFTIRKNYGFDIRRISNRQMYSQKNIGGRPWGNAWYAIAQNRWWRNWYQHAFRQPTVITGIGMRGDYTRGIGWGYVKSFYVLYRGEITVGGIGCIIKIAGEENYFIHEQADGGKQNTFI